MKKLIVTTALSISLLASSAYAKESFMEEFNGKSFSPQLTYGFKDDVPYTAWNKFWLGSAISGQVADYASTVYQIDSPGSTCVEGNPVFGEDPNNFVMAAIKLAYLGGVYYVAEYMIEGTPEEIQSARNYLFAPGAILGWGLAAHNMSLNCN